MYLISVRSILQQPHVSIPILPELLGESFTFYCNGRLMPGLRDTDELYELAHEFPIHSRSLARQYVHDVHEMLNQGILILITVSCLNHRIWTGLRSLHYLHKD